jgi:hypothetical protein
MHMSVAGGDFRIPDPRNDGAGIRELPPPQTPVEPSHSLDSLFGTGLSTTDMIIAGAIIALLLLVMLLPRRALVTSLTSQFADYGRAKSAGNSLYVLLVVLGAVTVVAILGNLWMVLKYTIPAGSLILLLLIVFLVSWLGARRSRVGR